VLLADEVGLGKTMEATSSSRSAGPLAIAPDETIEIDAETVERLLSVPARTVDVPTVAVPEDRLADAEAARWRTLLDAAERQNEELEAGSEKLDNYVDDLERRFWRRSHCGLSARFARAWKGKGLETYHVSCYMRAFG
jgi:hypothetical protein